MKSLQIYNIRKSNKGFTLVELLVVIGIIVILLSVVLVAVDPGKRLKQSRDAVRRQDVGDIIESVLQYAADNNGSFPSGIDGTAGSYQVLGTNTTGCNTTCSAVTTAVASCLDLSSTLVPTYLASIPIDPSVGTAANTYYAIDKSAAGRITIVSCNPENTSSISIQR